MMVRFQLDLNEVWKMSKTLFHRLVPGILDTELDMISIASEEIMEMVSIFQAWEGITKESILQKKSDQLLALWFPQTPLKLLEFPGDLVKLT